MFFSVQGDAFHLVTQVLFYFYYSLRERNRYTVLFLLLTKEKNRYVCIDLCH